MEQELKNTIKTGTTTLGIKCKDGIVLVADKRSSAGHLVANKEQQKIHAISDNIAVTQAGLVSDAQLLTKLIKAELRLIKIRNKTEPRVKETANLLATFLYHNIRKFSTVPGIVGFLLGGYDKEGFRLYDLGMDGSVTEHKDFTVSGSGSELALGVLEGLYTSELSVQDGIKLGIKSINSALRRDLASGNGIDVFTITKEGVKKEMTKHIDTGITTE